MMEDHAVQQAAQALHLAETTRSQIRMLSLDNPGMTIDDAYAVQRAWIALKEAEGRCVLGHKIGLTSKAMQQAVGITEPDFGALLDDMFYDDGARIPMERFIAPRVEAEIAFVLKQPLSPDCTAFDVLQATECVMPALEILDARMHRVDPDTKATRKVTDTISDNAANAALVLGSRMLRPHDVDLRWVASIVSRNAEVEETGVAAGVLNNPVNGIVWLARKLQRHGVALQPGQVILSGSFIRPIDARTGETFHADYGPFGSVSCHFC